MKKIDPLGTYVVLEVLPMPEKTAGGIIYSDKSGNMRGKVISVPPDTTVQPGHVVMFAGAGATVIEDKGLKGTTVGITEDNILFIEN